MTILVHIIIMPWGNNNERNTGFELTFQKCIVKTFCRKIGGNRATTPAWSTYVTCAKNTRNIRENTRNICEEYAYHTQG